MATIADIPAEHQGYASAMPKGLLGRLEPDEAQVRLAEVARLNGQAATAGLDRDMVRYYVTLAAKVRDAMPWAEYDAEMQRLIKRRDASPATGDGIQLRQSANGQIAALKGDHPQHWEPGAENPQDHQSARRPGRPQGTDVAGRFNTPAGGVPAGARSQNERFGYGKDNTLRTPDKAGGYGKAAMPDTFKTAQAEEDMTLAIRQAVQEIYGKRG